MAEEQTPDVAQALAGNRKKIVLFGGLLALVLLLGGVGGWLLLNADTEQTDAEAGDATPRPALYLQLEPAFLANYNVGGRLRYLQISMAVMAREQAALDALQLHMPMVRNRIVMLLTARDFAALQTTAGREQLQADVLSAVQDILRQETGAPGAEQMFFTNLVVQ